MAVDLYFLFVENTFGGFWTSNIALSGLLLIIFMLGGISLWTGLIYITVFLLCMAIGWSTPLISIFISVAIFFYFFIELKGFIDRGGGNF